jgi:predicted dehydrogenase
MSRLTNRRHFLKSSAMAGAGLWVASSGVLAKNASPNDKLNIGIIGVGGRGAENTKSVQGENIAALCDLNTENLAVQANAFPKAKTYADWRKMIEQKDLDAVVISTPDHHHALAAVNAMKRGLHVYCEKPLGHSVHEARAMQDTYNNSRVATQMGTQIHATDNYRRVVELVQSGAIGAVREAHVWCGRKGNVNGDRPQGAHPVPANINWDLWLGPAPERPFHPDYIKGGCMVWEQFWDFGNGCLGDMGSHLIDLPFWALKLERPTSVEATSSGLRDETYPEWVNACWEHPAGGGRPALKLFWYDGIQRPPSPEGHDLNSWGIGVMFVGDKGKLLADYGRRILLPEDQFKDFKPVEPWIAPSRGHHAEWIHACKTGAPTLCNFEYSGMLVENNLLGVVALRCGKKLEWDAANLKATNCPEADKYIRRQYRPGWSL